MVFELFNNEENKESYLNMKEAVIHFLQALNEDKSKAIYVMQHEIIPKVKTKEDIRYFLDMLAQFFEDLLNILSNREITIKSYATILGELANKLSHISDSLVEILKQRSIINLNVNTSLLLDHLTNYIVKE